MATFTERYQVATDAGFRARVGIALTRVAMQVMGEAKATEAWTRKRANLAEAVLRDPQQMANRFALIVASNDIPLSATDAELESQVRDAWDSIAGVLLSDKRGQPPT